MEMLERAVEILPCLWTIWLLLSSNLILNIKDNINESLNTQTLPDKLILMRKVLISHQGTHYLVDLHSSWHFMSTSHVHLSQLIRTKPVFSIITSYWNRELTLVAFSIYCSLHNHPQHAQKVEIVSNRWVY